MGIYDIRRPGAKEDKVHPVDAWIPVKAECFMNILITNDDGYDAEGLLAAYRATRSLGMGIESVSLSAFPPRLPIPTRCF